MVENDNEQLRQMLSTRLQSRGPLSWDDLCAALRNETVSQNNVAAKVEGLVGQEVLAECESQVRHKPAINIGHQTMTMCGDLITSGLSSEPNKMADILHGKGFISTVMLREISELEATKTDKARKLYLSVLECVKHNPHRYSDFLSILSENRLLYSDLIRALEETYQICMDVAPFPLTSQQILPHKADTLMTLSQDASREMSTKPGTLITVPQEEPSCKASTGHIGDQVKELEGNFLQLREMAMDELMDKVTVRKFRQILMNLPSAITNEHEQFLTKKYPLFEAANSIESIFLHLNFYLSFIDFSLLEHIIEHFGSESLRGYMTKYSSDVRIFQKETTISDIIPYLPQKLISPQGYSSLQLKLNIDITTSTLEDIDKFRRQFASEFLLSEFALFLASIQRGSLQVTWLIPNEFVSHLKDCCVRVRPKKPVDLLEIVVDGEILHTMSKIDSEPFPKKESEACSLRPLMSRGLAIMIKLRGKENPRHLKEHIATMAKMFDKKFNFKVIKEEAGDKETIAKILDRTCQRVEAPGSSKYPIIVVVTGGEFDSRNSLDLLCRRGKIIHISQDIIQPLLLANFPNLLNNPKVFFVSTARFNLPALLRNDFPDDEQFILCLTQPLSAKALEQELEDSHYSLQDNLAWLEDELEFGSIRVFSHLSAPVYLHPDDSSHDRDSEDVTITSTLKRRAMKINQAIKGSQRLDIGIGSPKIAETFTNLKFNVVSEDNVPTARKINDIIFAASSMVEYPSPHCPIVIIVRGEAHFDSLQFGYDKLNMRQDIITPFLPPSVPHLASNPKFFIFIIRGFMSCYHDDLMALRSTCNGNFLVYYASIPVGSQAINEADAVLMRELYNYRGSLEDVLQRIGHGNHLVDIVSHLTKPIYLTDNGPKYSLALPFENVDLPDDLPIAEQSSAIQRKSTFPASQ